MNTLDMKVSCLKLYFKRYESKQYAIDHVSRAQRDFVSYYMNQGEMTDPRYYCMMSKMYSNKLDVRHFIKTSKR